MHYNFYNWLPESAAENMIEAFLCPLRASKRNLLFQLFKSKVEDEKEKKLRESSQKNNLSDRCKQSNWILLLPFPAESEANPSAESTTVKKVADK